MEMHAPHKGRSLEPIDSLSLEDLEKEIQNLRSYAARSGLPPAVRAPGQAQRKRVLNVRHGSQPEDGLSHGSDEGDISFNFAKAESQIKGIKDELLDDYPIDMGFQKSGKIWDYSEHFPEIKSNFENKGQFLAAKSASKYPVQWTYNKAILQYQLPEFKAQPWQFPTNSIRSQFKGYFLKDDKTLSNSGGRFPEGIDALEFQSQMSDAAATKGNAEQSPQMKSGLFSNVANSFNTDGIMNEYNNRGYNTNNTLKHQGNTPNSSSSNVTQIDDSNIAFLRKMKLKMNYPKNKKEANTDGTIPIPIKKIDENNDYPGTSHKDQAGNSLDGVNKATNNRQITPKISTKHKIEISLEVGQPGKEIHKSLDLSKKAHNAMPLNLNEEIKERAEDKNKVARNRNVGKIRKSEADKVWDSIFETKQKAVAAMGYKTNTVPHTKHATRNYARELSYDPVDLVYVEKRKGNSAARYRDRNRPKTHHKYVPRPQYRPKPARKPQVTTKSTTTVDQSNATIFDKSNATILRGNRMTGKGHGPTTEYMAEIIDLGSDKVDIPLSGSSDWYDRIHGHRDIILAGAIMGGIGLLLIILSIAYMFINRRKLHQKHANKSNNKEYCKLGSSDEKVGLTKPQHSLFPLSSEESTTEESEDESKHSRTNVAATY